MYSIVANVELGLLDITLRGFWTPADLDGFLADLRRAIATFPRGRGVPASLYDVTKAAIQSRDVVDAMRAAANSPEFASRRVALYTGLGLARRQARRIAESRDTMRVFETRGEALAWLASVRPPAISAACAPVAISGTAPRPGSAARPCAPCAPSSHAPLRVPSLARG